MFKLNNSRKLSTVVKGFIKKPIQYEVRVESGDWSTYFGKYNNQKWGMWDSNSCWCLSCVNSLEDQLEWLWKNGKFTEESKKFFTDYGYIDADGDFSISERYLEILSGNEDGGGVVEEAWQLMQMYGCIPRSMLDYTQVRAQRYWDKASFNADYFNPAEVTLEMRNLGLEFLKHVSIAYQFIGDKWRTPNRVILKNALKMAPCILSVPVPEWTYLWNNDFVKWDGGKKPAHAVEMYAIDSEDQYKIFDQYLPNLKTLSRNYYLAVVTQGIAYPVKKFANEVVVETSYWTDFWTSVFNFFNNITPKIQIGRVQHSRRGL